MNDRIALASTLLQNACGGTHGVLETSPISVALTEGRDGGANRNAFSSCGELPMWLYERLGVRLPWVNRSATGYRWGQNINLLAAGPIGSNPLARRPKPGEMYSCGDTLLIWKALDPKNPSVYTRDAHARVVLSHPTGSMASVAEYGQPGGHVAVVNMTWGGPGRYIQSVLKLEDVLQVAADSGKLVEPEDWDTWFVRAVRPAPLSTSLREGDRGPGVRKLQLALNELGAGLTVDDWFGPKTATALKNFQRQAGLLPDGVAGPKTQAALARAKGAA